LLSIDYIKRDPAPGTDRVFVSYRIEFEVANSARTIAGVASYGAAIVNLSGSPQVEAISEKIVERKRYLTLDE
jgi:hypothetical protein